MCIYIYIYIYVCMYVFMYACIVLLGMYICEHTTAARNRHAEKHNEHDPKLRRQIDLRVMMSAYACGQVYVCMYVWRVKGRGEHVCARGWVWVWMDGCLAY